ncbi:MAG TPA: SpoIVB peptidase S55 domain-containing protein [Candidatus Polarisedimenticolia bacterium]|nr:SpoIVB peptidase S55 domain-containing protein [Candidatus Polarisedimenticolia bacterium]
MPTTPPPTGLRGARRSAALPLLALVLLGGVFSRAAAQEILPFSEVKTGMKGVGRTVFSGTRIDEFQVEVIGTLQNVAPQRNLILVRLTGGPLAETGVLSGMSGSPIYINSRLAGAVAYTWGFAKEAVAGVTPIQEMLAVEEKEQPARAARSGGALPPAAGRAGLAFLRDPERLPAYFANYFDSTVEALARKSAATSAEASMAPLRTPLLFTGFPGSAVDALAPALARAGLVPVQGGSTAKAGTGADASIVPGAGVGIKLVRGDVEIAAICTVTYREKERVMACGHPLLNLGPTDLIMTTAAVNGLFPSLNESFKFASSGEEVGAFRQDRATGVFGYLGKKPRLLPVRLELQPEKGRSKRFAFDIVEDPFLAPYLLYAALNGVLSNEQKDYGEVSLEYKEGSTIRVAGQDDIALKNVFSGDLATQYTSGTVAFLTQILLNNEYHPTHIDGINLILGYSDERRTARVERAWVSKDHARAGETVQVSVVLKPFRGAEVTRQIDVEIPDEVPPGRLVVQVGDGLALARAEGGEDDDFSPRDLSQLIWLINHLRSNDRVYVVLTRADNGIVFQGERLPNLPPSIAQVMVRPQNRGNYLRLWYRGVAEEDLDTGYMLSGYKLLSIDVEE